MGENDPLIVVPLLKKPGTKNPTAQPVEPAEDHSKDKVVVSLMALQLARSGHFHLLDRQLTLGPVKPVDLHSAAVLEKISTPTDDPGWTQFRQSRPADADQEAEAAERGRKLLANLPAWLRTAVPLVSAAHPVLIDGSPGFQVSPLDLADWIQKQRRDKKQ